MAIRSYRVTNSRSGEALGVFRAQSAGGARRAAARAEGYTAAEVRAMTGNHPRLAHFDVSVVSKKVANPSASCPRQSPKFNAYQGRTVKYRKKSYEIEGCGIGRTAKRSIGKQEEGTYALRALKTGKKKYVAKRVIRDLAYHRGGKAILGMPKRKKPVKNPSRRGKLHGAAKAEFLARMAAGRRRAGR